jgi:hypothetical protein
MRQGPEDVVLNGPEKKKAFDQLQQSVQGQLTLSLDDKTGKVTSAEVKGRQLGMTLKSWRQQLMTIRLSLI